MRFCYHVNLPLAGQSTAEQNGARRTTADGRAGVAFLPDGPLAIRFSPDAMQYVLKFPKELLEAHAAKLAGCPVGEAIRFDLSFDLTTAPVQALIAPPVSCTPNSPGRAGWRISRPRVRRRKQP
jgi:hypothetical protein